jgi:uncharacterized protein GlcG (DUF336 family)
MRHRWRLSLCCFSTAVRVGAVVAVIALLSSAGVAGAQSTPDILGLALNKPIYTVGDTFVLTLMNETGAAATGDLFLFVQVPDGSAYAFDGTSFIQVADHGARITPARTLTPFRTNTTVTTASEVILSMPLPTGLGPGVYTAFALLVRPGGNPFDPSQWRSNLAQRAFPFAKATPGGSPFLSAADVSAIIRTAAVALPATTMVIAVTDREGNVLGVFRKPSAPAIASGNFGAPVNTNDLAVSLARTGAFFSNDQAPLSSRTVRFISGIHFPPGIRNKPNAALYGIENTNRGCELNTMFNPGKTIIPSRSLNGLPCNTFDTRGCGAGITTGKANVLDDDPNAVNPGGVPIFKEGTLVGGIGVAGIDPTSAEFAAFVGSVPDSRFGPIVPDPGAVILDGIQLPFVNQTTPLPGAGTGTMAGGTFVVSPVDSPLGAAGVPDGWLVGPFASADLSISEVQQIVLQAVNTANATRAAIRLPLGSRTRMMIAVSDLQGNLLGVFRMPDATIFSIDVSVAKARNVVFFSGPDRLPSDLPGVPPLTAVTNRTISFGAQPLYPPGIDSSSAGPFFQLYVNDVAVPCRQGSQAPNLNESGIVFFPGSTPLFKNGRMVGGLGVSGDGVEQDDLVTAGGATGFAPPEEIRADQVFVGGIRLPYLKFPRDPFAP